MRDIFYKLYKKLEAIDINMMIHIDEHAYRQLTADLKKRNDCLSLIQEQLDQVTEEISSDDLAYIRETHLEAQGRHQKIVAVIKSLSDRSRGDMMQCGGKRQGTSVYLRKQSNRRISA